MTLSSACLCFPPCRVSDTSHVTLSLTNTGCTPVSFVINDKHLPSQFSFTPKVGIIPAGATFVVAARFQAMCTTPVSGAALLVLNGNAAAARRVAVTAAGYGAEVSLDVGGMLLCKPTCAGATSKRAIRLFNHSRLPISYAWDFPSHVKDILAIEPATGILRGDTDASLVCIFHPDAVGNFQAVATCHVTSTRAVDAATAPHGAPTISDPAPTPSDQLNTLKLAISGEGTEAALSMQPASVDLGPITVGRSVPLTVTVFNRAPGALAYSFETEDSSGHRAPVATRDPGSDGPPDAVVGYSHGVTLSTQTPSGTLPGRSVLDVPIYLYPAQRGLVATSLICRTSRPGSQAASDNGGPTSSPGMAPQEVATSVSALACFPTLEVQDVFCDEMPKRTAWDALRIPALNKLLTSPVSETERWLREQEHHAGMTLTEVMEQLPSTRLALGPVVQGCIRTVTFRLVNTGRCDPYSPMELSANRTFDQTLAEAQPLSSA